MNIRWARTWSSYWRAFVVHAVAVIDDGAASHVTEFLMDGRRRDHWFIANWSWEVDFPHYVRG